MKKMEDAIIENISFLTEDICDLKLKCNISQEAICGQFIMLYPDNGENLLPRPISICEIDKENGTLRIVFGVVGKGTKLFSQLKKNDVIRIMGPCGNGYNIASGKALLVGGGIGVPPLLQLCKELKGDCNVVLGFRTGSFLKQDFEKTGAKVYISTDDGSQGFKGNVIDLIKSENIQADVIYSCGPSVMLKFLSQYAMDNNISCQVSMEERMACGLGACVGCVVKIKENNQIIHKKVCKDGPVFDCREVVW